MSAIDIIFYVLVLLFSIVIHEVSHGYMAEYFGDSTARHADRLTLNPIKHLDMVGSILLPALLVLSRAPFFFGWAKPVPVNFNRLRNPKRDMMWVGMAGPIVNIILAVLFSVVLRISQLSSDDQQLFE